MRTLKMQEFFKEFNWLERYVTEMEKRTGEEISVITIERVDKNLLQQKPIEFISYYYLLLDSDGNQIREVGILLPPKKRWFGRGYKIDETESVADALVKLGAEAERIHYVLSFEGNSLCISKPPKTFTLVGWVAEQRKRAAQEIKTELAAIDAEAEKQ